MKTKFLCMYLVMVCNIVFPASRDRQQLSINKVKSVSGESSWKNLTDSAKIELPSKIYFKGQSTSIKELLKPGDPVEIYLGYNQTVHKRFTGFVSFVSPQVPVVIECENLMYKLKRTPANFNVQSDTLPNLLKKICPSDIKIDAANIQLGSFKAIKTNVAKVLEKLKEDYGIVAYFKGDTLIAGKVYFNNALLEPVGEFDFTKNIKKGHSLVFREADEVKLKVEAISNLRSGKKITVEVGDSDGEERTLNFYNIESESELKTIAEQELSKLKYAGFRGNFNTYGLPYVDHTDIIKLIDPDYPEKNGNYYIDILKWSFDASSGYQNNVELGAITK